MNVIINIHGAECEFERDRDAVYFVRVVKIEDLTEFVDWLISLEIPFLSAIENEGNEELLEMLQ